MQQRTLGTSDLRVSAIGLGTMTWGEQNTEREAFDQLDLAVDHGVTLIDAAEMYPVPPRAETQGATEAILGRWLARRGRHDGLVIATKITGPGRSFAWIRDGRTRLSANDVVHAAEGSLRRLGIDRIDLFQVHWPARATNVFGQRGFVPRAGDVATPPEETLRGLQRLVEAGTVRAVGLSNETPWGVFAFLRAAAEAGLPRVHSVQNAYHLLNRTAETGLTEVLYREGVSMLAYSPLAMGLLTGKYEGGAQPEGARLVRYDRFRRYMTPRARACASQYVSLAREAGLDPAAAALAWCASQPTVASALVGATSVDQLRANLAAATLTLPADLFKAFNAVHEESPDPSP